MFFLELFRDIKKGCVELVKDDIIVLIYEIIQSIIQLSDESYEKLILKFKQYQKNNDGFIDENINEIKENLYLLGDSDSSVLSSFPICQLTHQTKLCELYLLLLEIFDKIFGTIQNIIKDIKRTIEFAKTLNPDFVQFSIATPFPGTELFHLISGKDQLQEPWESYVYADLKSVQSSFSKTRKMNGRNLRNWNRKAYVSFYLRRRYIWNRFKKITSFDELKTNIVGLRLLFEMVS